ncbi:MAG: bL35 family ribosomal protein [Pseudomonadota bacterium]
MTKTHSGLKKRIIKRSSGSYKRGRSCRHIMRTRSQNRKRVLRKQIDLNKSHMKLLRKFLQSY